MPSSPQGPLSPNIVQAPKAIMSPTINNCQSAVVNVLLNSNTKAEAMKVLVDQKTLPGQCTRTRNNSFKDVIKDHDYCQHSRPHGRPARYHQEDEDEDVNVVDEEDDGSVLKSLLLKDNLAEELRRRTKEDITKRQAQLRSHSSAPVAENKPTFNLPKRAMTVPYKGKTAVQQARSVKVTAHKVQPVAQKVDRPTPIRRPVAQKVAPELQKSVAEKVLQVVQTDVPKAVQIITAVGDHTVMPVESVPPDDLFDLTTEVEVAIDQPVVMYDQVTPDDVVEETVVQTECVLQEVMKQPEKIESKAIDMIEGKIDNIMREEKMEVKDIEMVEEKIDEKEKKMEVKDIEVIEEKIDGKEEKMEVKDIEGKGEKIDGKEEKMELKEETKRRTVTIDQLISEDMMKNPSPLASPLTILETDSSSDSSESSAEMADEQAMVAADFDKVTGQIEMSSLRKRTQSVNRDIVDMEIEEEEQENQQRFDRFQNENFMGSTVENIEKRNKRNYRRREVCSPLQRPNLPDNDQFFDKLPNYFTALSRPEKHLSKKTDTVVRLVDNSVPDRDRDPSPDHDEPVYNKLPAYFSCFTNSTKYDDSMPNPKPIRNSDPLGLEEGIRESNPPSLDGSIHSSRSETPNLVIASRANSCSRPGSRVVSRSNSPADKQSTSRSRSRSKPKYKSRSRSRSRSKSKTPLRRRSSSPSHTRWRSRSHSQTQSNYKYHSRSRSHSPSRRNYKSHSRSRSRYRRSRSIRRNHRQKRYSYSSSRSSSR